MQVLKWIADNPILTVMLLLILLFVGGGVVVEVIKAVR